MQITAFLLLVALAACGNRAEQSTSNASDSSIVALDTSIISEPSAPSNKMPEQQEADTVKLVGKPLIRTGRHKLTLQWISWDKPGSVMISTADDGWFTVKGEQKSEGSSDYLRIDGKVMPLSDKEILFDGDITYSVATINSGEPCVKTGRQNFLSTKGRKYWRLQNMLHCVEGTTDYVDIYF